MIKLASTWKAHWRKSGRLQCAIVLMSTLVFCTVALLPIALWMEGFHGVLALAVAALISLATGLACLAVSALQNSRENAFQELLISMTIRMLPPLAICLVLASEANGREYLSFVSYLLVFYMLTLSVETYFFVQRIKNLGQLTD